MSIARLVSEVLWNLLDAARNTPLTPHQPQGTCPAPSSLSPEDTPYIIAVKWRSPCPHSAEFFFIDCNGDPSPSPQCDVVHCNSTTVIFPAEADQDDEVEVEITL